MNFKDGIFSREYYFHGFDTDHHATAKVSTVLSMMHETAWSHVTHLKRGWADLQEMGLFWAIAKIYLKIFRLPKWNDRVTVQTWARDRESIMFLREYRMLDQDGNVLAAASSEWMVIDIAASKIVRTDRLEVTIDTPEIEPLVKRVPRVPRTEFEGNFPQHKVLLSDLDMNLHVNNTSYVKWLIDQYSYDFYNQHEIDELTVNYLTEIKPDDLYCLKIKEYENKQHIASIFNGEGKECCKISVNWRPRSN